MFMSHHEQMIQVLREHGLRITEQRRSILDVIERSDKHPTAEEIFDDVRKINPGISLATVYRTLAMLRENGLIEQRFFSPEHDRSHFELSTASDHFHFLCLGCGKIIEFESADVVHILTDQLKTNHSVAKVIITCVCVEGYCAECVRRSK
jgi:Fur family transcriptional regulator, ferric uptake regulator